jgi:hypothetical protein
MLPAVTIGGAHIYLATMNDKVHALAPVRALSLRFVTMLTWPTSFDDDAPAVRRQVLQEQCLAEGAATRDRPRSP